MSFEKSYSIAESATLSTNQIFFMQDIASLEGKSLSELREIGKTLGIRGQMNKKELTNRIIELVQASTPEAEAPQQPQPKKRGRRPKIAYEKVSAQKDATQETPAAQTAAEPKEPSVQNEPERQQPTPTPSIEQRPVATGKKHIRKSKNAPQQVSNEEPQPAKTAKEEQPAEDFLGEVEGEGVLEIMPDGYGFLRSADYNFLLRMIFMYHSHKSNSSVSNPETPFLEQSVRQKRARNTSRW